MDLLNVCRTCLGANSLNPIFVNLSDHNRYSAAIYATTGIKIEFNDGLSQKMCTKCINYLNESLKFRKKCRDTETQLLKLKEINNPKPKASDADISPIKVKILASIDSKNVNSMETGTDFKIETDIKTETGGLTKEQEKTVIEMDYMNYETLDDDDKPLKCLINMESDSDADTKSDVMLFIESKEEKRKVIQKEVDLSNYPFSDIDNKRVTCKLCQKNLSVRSIDGHMSRRHPGADERKVKCELCDTFVLRNKLNRHKLLIHGSECFRCGYCKSEFDNAELLVQHVTTCTAKKKKRKVSESGRELSECDVCHKKMQRASLRMHKAIKHAGLGPVCEHCGRRFSNKFRLNEHYRAKHGYEKFKCSYCDFQSAGVMALRNHERRHRGEKPFVCESCGAKFHAAYLLAQHKQSHRTEKLLKCDLCPASFKANNSLHMHKITCHSTSLFKCTMCSKAYSCRHYTVKHLRHFHQFKGPVPPLQRISALVGGKEVPEQTDAA